MTSTTIGTAPLLPWNMFGVRVSAVQRLTPSLVRVTFRGHPVPTADGNPDVDAVAASSDGLKYFADNGFDQRFKLILPPGGDPGRGLAGMPTGADWFARWRGMDLDSRPAVRTYTVRTVRPAVGRTPTELDVDMVLHGTVGPASRWVTSVLNTSENNGTATGFEALLLGPDSRYDGAHGGLEFLTRVTDDLLLVGDETALPAVASILERLPENATGTAVVEVPTAADALDLRAPAGITVVWLPRDGAPNGEKMAAAALQWSPSVEPRPNAAASGAPDPENWDELAWDVPEGGSSGIRAWVAGEAGAVRTIRRHLVGPYGLARSDVAFMGYWRLGRAEN